PGAKSAIRAMPRQNQFSAGLSKESAAKFCNLPQLNANLTQQFVGSGQSRSLKLSCLSIGGSEPFRPENPSRLLPRRTAQPDLDSCDCHVVTYSGCLVDTRSER